MANRKKILVFIDWFLPGYKAGGPIRSMANMTDHLQDFDFFVVTRNTDYTDTNPYASVKSDQWNKLSENVSVLPCPNADFIGIRGSSGFAESGARD